MWWGGVFFFFQSEDGIRDLVRSRGLGDVYKRQVLDDLLLNQPHRQVAQVAEAFLVSAALVVGVDGAVVALSLGVDEAAQSASVVAPIAEEQTPEVVVIDEVAHASLLAGGECVLGTNGTPLVHDGPRWHLL